MSAAAIAAGLLCLVFARAALHKLSDREDFRAVLAEYRLLPGWAVAPVAHALPLLELLAAALLLVPPARAAAAALAFVLLALYAAAIAANLLRGRRTLDCGCGGPGRGIGWGHAARNAALAALAWLPLAAPAAPAGGGALAALISTGCVALLFLLFLLFEQLLGNRAHLIAFFDNGTSS